MYADNTLIVCKANNVSGAIEKAQKALDRMILWCEENKFTIDHEKTKYMLIKHRKVSCEPQVKMGSYKLGTVSLYE